MSTHFGPVALLVPRHEVVTVRQPVSNLFQLGQACFGGEIDSLEDLACHLVRHLTLVSVRPEPASVDVPFPELCRDLLVPHVLPCMRPGYVPALSN